MFGALDYYVASSDKERASDPHRRDTSNTSSNSDPVQPNLLDSHFYYARGTKDKSRVSSSPSSAPTTTAATQPQRPPRPTRRVVSPSPSGTDSPNRNAGVDAARARHRQQQQQQHEEEDDEFDYIDATHPTMSNNSNNSNNEENQFHYPSHTSHHHQHHRQTRPISPQKESSSTPPRSVVFHSISNNTTTSMASTEKQQQQQPLHYHRQHHGKSIAKSEDMTTRMGMMKRGGMIGEMRLAGGSGEGDSEETDDAADNDDDADDLDRYMAGAVQVFGRTGLTGGGMRSPPLSKRHRQQQQHPPPSSSATGIPSPPFNPNELLLDHQNQINLSSTATTTTSSSSYLAQLKEAVPFLSDGFACSESDARTLMAFVQMSKNNKMNASSNAYHLQQQHQQDGDRILVLEGQINILSSRLERKTEDVEKLRDDIGEAKSRYQALEQRFRQTTQQNAQRREESRKQLLIEEGKVAKLNLQNKNLQMEVDRLKRLLHQSLGTPSGGGK